MSQSLDGSYLPIVPTMALWNWNVSSGTTPTVLGYPPNGQPTKSGVTPQDIKDYITIPIQNYALTPPIPISDTVITNWIRWAEDDIENATSIRLCQTWVAAPPATTPAAANAIGIGTASGYQQLGIDYDLAEAAYDFFFPRAQDEGWSYQALRWKPLRDPTVGIIPTAVKNYAYLYPLLSEYFRAPISWIVEDQNYSYVRLVPAQNVQMLPLFAMQLAFMGFAESVPGALWLQYRAGLTPADYTGSFSFMKELVIVGAAIRALMNMQGSVNFGATETNTQIDGLLYRVRFSEKGAFIGQITSYKQRYDELMHRAKANVSGPVFGVF
jgi:hypothetical protein